MSLFDRRILIGSTVHYVMRAEDYLPGATRKGYEHRPAFVVDAPPKGEDLALAWPVNLSVILAGQEDGIPAPPAVETGRLWLRDVAYSSDHMPGTWHWPE